MYRDKAARRGQAPPPAIPVPTEFVATNLFDTPPVVARPVPVPQTLS
jgi:hypothetical protein